MGAMALSAFTGDLFEVVRDRGYHADFLDVGSVGVAVFDREESLCSFLNPAETAVAVVGELFGSLAGVDVCLLYHLGLDVVESRKLEGDGVFPFVATAYGDALVEEFDLVGLDAEDVVDLRGVDIDDGGDDIAAGGVDIAVVVGEVVDDGGGGDADLAILDAVLLQEVADDTILAVDRGREFGEVGARLLVDDGIDGAVGHDFAFAESTDVDYAVVRLDVMGGKECKEAQEGYCR